MGSAMPGILDASLLLITTVMVGAHPVPLQSQNWTSARFWKEPKVIETLGRSTSGEKYYLYLPKEGFTTLGLLAGLEGREGALEERRQHMKRSGITKQGSALDYFTHEKLRSGQTLGGKIGILGKMFLVNKPNIVASMTRTSPMTLSTMY